jgi:hypothetical protein
MLNFFDPDFLIVRADVHIEDIEPPIRRILELPLDLNFAQLHEVLQAAFGWTDSHLHQFNLGGLTIGAPEFNEDDLDGPRTFEASEVRLRDLTFPDDPDPTLIVIYQYDFGDDWRHHIVLRRQPREEAATYPRCVDGVRSGPPEDVGGSSGYAEFLEAWQDPSHDEHKAMRRWAGRKFDPERFDLKATNKAIAQALRAAKGGYRFRGEDAG